MPEEYEALVAALKLTDIPFAEYGWKTRPEGAYGVVQLEFEPDSLNGDGMKQDRCWEGSIDLFYPKLSDREDLIEEIEETLEEVCGDSWELNSTQYEPGTNLFHVEWVFQVQDIPETPDPPATTETAEQPETDGDG